MNAEQLEAIKRGEETYIEFESASHHDDLNMAAFPTHLDISVPDLGTHIFRCETAKTAREIADALNAWADAREDRN